MTSKSSTTPGQNTPQSSQNNVRATVTGVDSGGQLFRDDARIILLKGQKCIYHSKVKPSPDNSVMIDLRIGSEPWRSNGKIKAVSSAGRGQEGFRVTIELERAHSAVIEAAEEEINPQATAAATSPDISPKRKIDPPPEPPEATPPDLRPAPTPAAETTDAVADLVQSIVNLELEQLKFEMKDVVAKQAEAALREPLAKIEAWKRELQGAIAGQVDAALRQPLAKIAAEVEQLRTRPALAEDSVRRIAADAAQNAQIEWATTSQKIVAQTVRSAVALDGGEQRRELRALVSGEIEAALRSLRGSRLDEKMKAAVDAGIEEHSRKRPPITESAVRQMATQVAEGVQLQWASSKLQKMIAEAVRSAMTSDRGQRQVETVGIIKSEVEVALRGLLSARVDAVLEKTVTANIEHYFQTPSAMDALQKVVAEAVHQALQAEEELEREMKAALQKIVNQRGS